MLKEREREVQTAQKKRGDDHVPSFLKPDSRVYKIILVLEKAVKVMLFDCQMCGQCRLMYTGFICPMQCPKQMGLGPCGGSVNGVCELGRKEETWEKCVWCSIYDRLNRWDLLELLDQVDAGPLNHTLHGSSSWINAYLGRIRTPDKQLREKIAKKIFKYYKQKAVNLFKINRTERLEKTSFIQWSI
ncbi:MAG: methylenetetrahydrofolate reductase C-terminal domain-containing protein [Candidatus Omnitrophica bacterium]|nr:methylenetetrahydrofolate reductase C-terminal domain-containing protein [Candidatus Omnitrophota bacterium]